MNTSGVSLSEKRLHYNFFGMKTILLRLWALVTIRRVVVVGLALLLLAVGSYYRLQRQDTNATAYYVVNPVATGTVDSGIQATGQIVAAQKLDLNVYKQLNKIAAVNVSNGSEVKKGDVLVSFDKNDAYVSLQAARVAVTSAQLDYQTKQEQATDPNSTIRSLENSIATYKKNISDAEEKKRDALLTFMNANTTVEAASDRQVQQIDHTKPTISGRYTSTVRGEYTIDIYSSSALSGYSYRLSGLESDMEPVVLNTKVPLGTRGLYVTFPTGIQPGDTWVVKLPNTASGEYDENLRTYNQAVADAEASIATAQTNLQNAELQLKNQKQTDTTNYRDLTVDQAAQSLSQARQKLTDTYDTVQERDVVAPFSGSIQDMANVVVGATPVGGSEDTISLGTLVSDTYETTFTLGASDVAKIKPDQKVKVTITSLPKEPTFTAHVTEISSLPSSSGVAQYQVTALLDYDRASSSIALREGMLATVEVVQQEKSNVLRVPRSALTYADGKYTVEVADSLTADQEAQRQQLGVVSVSNRSLTTHPVTVTVGILGQYYAEITSGLTVGELVVSSSQAPSETGAAVQTFGVPGAGGGGHLRDEQQSFHRSSSQSTSHG